MRPTRIRDIKMTKFNSSSRVMEPETISNNGASSKSQMIRGNSKEFKVMLKKIFFGVTVACIAILFCVSSSFKSPVNSENNTDQIIGVWKLVSTDIGEMRGERVKIITKGHFIWTHTFNKMLVASAGGTYTFDGETYTENIEFGTQDMSNFFDKKGVVKIRFEGKRMHYTGLLADVIPLNEVWERVE